MRRFEDGLDGAHDLDDGAAIPVDGVPVRTSRNAGSYYCAHAFFLLSRWAENQAHGPRVGFLHVPADPETTGDRAPQPERHVRTKSVVAAALRGFLDEHPGSDDVRVLVTGYGPFQGVVDNPTGSFVADDTEVADTLRLATRTDASSLDPIAERGAMMRVTRAGRLVVARLVLEVDDAALHVETPGSLPWALRMFAPHAALSMGVHRAGEHFRVEVLPTSAGLAIHDTTPRHNAGVAERIVLAENASLARAIESGARALKL